MRLVGTSDVGMVREINQDSFLMLENKEKNIIAFGVADGLGGHNAGELASALCMDILREYFNISNKFYDEMKSEVKGIIEYANKRILDFANENEEALGMGTTLTLCIFHEGDAFVVHIGDSRCYTINQNEIKQITVDHSLVSHMVASGEITKEEAEHHPNRNIITNALGTQEEFFIDTYELDLKKGDIVLICSDGLSEHVSKEDIMDIVNNNDLEEAKHLLIDKANENGGTDNITVVLFDGGIE
ncbi:Stp1/IreP family PP2C-type Ser/Thr phosphatase [Anaerofustis sp.]|uniref:Stp1/IreP family PP2C-type Ser/Thr phosphatase n=1 Tax=Anaerofustis sp. TaxID=1872517 RepID=UPI0025B7E899|nr:Stp1/IreP family PP2C-type Ser/Thr phosphatase [Anaerofustis sp.]